MSEPVSCVPDDFCKHIDDGSLISYTPNMELAETFDNWVQKLDLTCATGSQIGALGSVYFSGWVFSLIFLPRIADLYGRYLIIVLVNFASVLATIMILATHSYSVMLVALFIQGACVTGVLTLSLLYLYENMQRDRYTSCLAVCFFAEGVMLIYVSFYFNFMSKNWLGAVLPFSIGGMVAAVISATYFLESPRYLVKTCQWDRL